MSPLLHALQVAVIVFGVTVLAGMAVIGFCYLITAPNEPDEVGDEHN